MHVTWKPEDGTDDRTWEFDPDNLLASEGRAIEKAYGAPGGVEEWLNKLRVNEVRARLVLLWHLLKQDHPKLRIDDVPDFRLRQVKVEMSSIELRSLWEQMSKTKMDDDTLEAFKLAFDRDLADAVHRETGVYEGDIVEDDEEPGPKAGTALSPS